jgi:hypothetical protein
MKVMVIMVVMVGGAGAHRSGVKASGLEIGPTTAYFLSMRQNRVARLLLSRLGLLLAILTGVTPRRKAFVDQR